LTSSYASKNQPELQEVLFSPDDVSIRGVRTPAKTRASSHRELELVAGHAEMPGLRITMEDALLCFQSWASHEQREQWALFGVCDGHNDFGQASGYIVEHVVDVLRDSLDQHQLQDDKDWDSIWTRTCLKLDASYKETNLGGGTTGVFALVSAKSIIVANVGDSRCIMVQREIESQPTGQETQTESPPELKDEGTASALKGYVLSPLSQDHKPELEEEQIRVQKAGLTVTAETFKEQDGQEETIYKITRSANERISMSRSFGDYEYKSNESLGPEEQAVIAVPEIKAHARDGDRDLFLILACDGVWDVMSNEDAATFVLEQVEKELERKDDGSCLAQVADRLLEECLRLGSRDNMSVIIVALSAFAEKVSAGQVVRGKTLDFAGVST
jgi:serine/threonine protein phosphatase PrpC